jgi:hypothetical protein
MESDYFNFSMSCTKVSAKTFEMCNAVRDCQETDKIGRNAKTSHSASQWMGSTSPAPGPSTRCAFPTELVTRALLAEPPTRRCCLPSLCLTCSSVTTTVVPATGSLRHQHLQLPPLLRLVRPRRRVAAHHQHMRMAVAHRATDGTTAVATAAPRVVVHGHGLGIASNHHRHNWALVCVWSFAFPCLPFIYL